MQAYIYITYGTNIIIAVYDEVHEMHTQFNLITWPYSGKTNLIKFLYLLLLGTLIALVS